MSKTFIKKKLNLEEELDDNKIDKDFKFTINKQYAQNFETRKKRELMDQAKVKYGEDFDKIVNKNKKNGEEEDSSSSTDEDENGELINEDISQKFLATLTKIKEKQSDIYDTNKVFFKDDDFNFALNEQNNGKKKQEKQTYKDIVREDILKKMKKDDQQGSNDDEEDDDNSDSNSINQKQIGETPFDEQIRIKNEFKKAAKIDIEEQPNQNDQEDEEDGDEMFKIKQKTPQQIQEEQKNLEKFIKKNKNKGNKEDQNLLKRYWGNENDLNDQDKFLRDYILNKGWIETENQNTNKIDSDDEEYLDKMEEYEKNYNFRFEEPNADQIIQYKRNIEDTARLKESKRKQERLRKQERKQQEKQQLEEEIKQLKNIKKSEIIDRLSKINQISGTEQEDDKFMEFLEKDYDPKEYDQQMNQKFGEDYYEQSDENEEELQEYIKKIEKKQLLDTDKMENEDDDQQQQNQIDQEDDKDNILETKVNIPLGLKSNLTENEISAMCTNDKDNQQNKNETSQINNIFWYCDCCKKGIKEYEQRFDCQQCTDYTLCKRCYENKMHNNKPDHRLKKFIVPKNCPPPSDAEILKMLNNFKVCKHCLQKLDEFCSYYQLQQSDDFILCEECYDNENENQDKYNFIQSTKMDVQTILEENPQSLKEKNKDKVIEQLIDDYYALDFEDIIAGNIKTRFKYIDVPKESYGLSDENLLFTDTKLLNSYVPIKKLAPYREDLYQIRKDNSIENKIQQELNQIKNKKQNKKYKFLTKKLEKMKMMKKKILTVDQFKKKPRLFIEFEDKTDESNIKLKVSNNRLNSYGIGNEKKEHKKDDNNNKNEN